MEKVLQDSKGAIPHRDVIRSLAEKFSASPERDGKILVQTKQVWTWFQNKRYSQKSKSVKVQGNATPLPRDDSVAKRAVTSSAAVPSGRKAPDAAEMEFEAKSSRDGAWYDVSSFVTHRMFESGDPEVRVRFAGFGAEEDEWVNVKKCVRQRSLPCESSECVAVLPGDLILCFQEGKEQALYFDAHVLDAQRRRHDVRGCRCRFLVRYDNDQSEEIVPLRKICRRPETDYRLKLVHASKELSSMELDQGSQQVKDIPAAPNPIGHFGEGTREEFHLSAEVPRSTSQVLEANVQSSTALTTSSVLHAKEASSAESQTSLPATEIDSIQNMGAPSLTRIDDASNIKVDAAAKSTIQD